MKRKVAEKILSETTEETKQKAIDYANSLVRSKYDIEKLLEVLNEKFDEYHQIQLEINNKNDADYYLFMGKANAIGEVIDLIKEKIDLINDFCECDSENKNLDESAYLVCRACDKRL